MINLKKTAREIIEESFQLSDDLLLEDCNLLIEKLITFGGQAYPKFGNVIILAGGAGSGKGFVKDNLIGAEGFTFDVDALKTLAAKTPFIIKKMKDLEGIDIRDLAKNLKDPKNVAELHRIVGDLLRLDDNKLRSLYTSILTAHPDRKPNLIFDVTLKSLTKLSKLSTQVKSLGYDNKNIHLVWVINDIEVAKQQNAERARTVPAEILVNTHRGASQTMNDIVHMGDDIKKYMDGDIVFAFNKVGVDSDIIKSDKSGSKNPGNPDSKTQTKGGKIMTFKDPNFFYVKRSGQSTLSLDSINKDLRHKIQSYVPSGINWEQ